MNFNIKINIKELILTSIVLIVIDLFVLNILSNFFNKQIISIQGSPIRMNYIAGILCYVFLVFLLYNFIISKNGKLGDAFLLGFLTYGIYELTTKALLIKWKWNTVIVDTIWGGSLFYLTTYIVYNLSRII